MHRLSIRVGAVSNLARGSTCEPKEHKEGLVNRVEEALLNHPNPSSDAADRHRDDLFDHHLGILAESVFSGSLDIYSQQAFRFRGVTRDEAEGDRQEQVELVSLYHDGWARLPGISGARPRPYLPSLHGSFRMEIESTKA